jgi:hypothetical protein
MRMAAAAPPAPHSTGRDERCRLEPCRELLGVQVGRADEADRSREHGDGDETRRAGDVVAGRRRNPSVPDNPHVTERRNIPVQPC